MERKSKHLTVCCSENKLLLNVSKTKQLIDFRKREVTHEPVYMEQLHHLHSTVL